MTQAKTLHKKWLKDVKYKKEYARLEGGRVNPSTKTLERLAKATGSRLKIGFEFKSA
jgi:transcriptional regulator with XRE-family HTH domain